MKIVLAVFVLLDVILLAYTADNYTEVSISSSWFVQDADTPYGNCTAREISKIDTTCTTPAIHGLQKKKACMSVAEQHLKCIFDFYNTSKCFEDMERFHSDIFTNDNVNLTAILLCENAGLIEHVIYQIDKVKGGVRYSFPCSISEETFVEELKKCNSKMLQMWRNNTADSRICREYFSTKQCQKQIFDKKCNYTGGSKTLNDLLVGSYNPFCPGNVDFTSGANFCTLFGTFALTAMLMLPFLISQQ